MQKSHKIENEKNQILKQQQYQEDHEAIFGQNGKYDVPVNKVVNASDQYVAKENKKGKFEIVKEDEVMNEKVAEKPMPLSTILRRQLAKSQKKIEGFDSVLNS